MPPQPAGVLRAGRCAPPRPDAHALHLEFVGVAERGGADPRGVARREAAMVAHEPDEELVLGRVVHLAREAASRRRRARRARRRERTAPPRSRHGGPFSSTWNATDGTNGGGGRLPRHLDEVAAKPVVAAAERVLLGVLPRQLRPRPADHLRFGRRGTGNTFAAVANASSSRDESTGIVVIVPRRGQRNCRGEGGGRGCHGVRCLATAAEHVFSRRSNQNHSHGADGDTIRARGRRRG